MEPLKTEAVPVMRGQYNSYKVFKLLQLSFSLHCM